MKKIFLLATSIPTFLLLIVLSEGCKKSNDSKNADSDFTGISATIDGKPWKCSKPLVVYDTTIGFITLTGTGDTGNSGTMVIDIYDSITVGAAQTFRTEAIEITFTKANGASYSSNWIYGGYGNVTLISWDKSTKKVSGTFSGSFFNPHNFDPGSTGIDSITVAGGKFGGTYTKQ